MFRNGAITVNLMDIGEIVRLETAVWQALVDGHAEADARRRFLGRIPNIADAADELAEVVRVGHGSFRTTPL